MMGLLLLLGGCSTNKPETSTPAKAAITETSTTKSSTTQSSTAQASKSTSTEATKLNTTESSERQSTKDQSASLVAQTKTSSTSDTRFVGCFQVCRACDVYAELGTRNGAAISKL